MGNSVKKQKEKLQDISRQADALMQDTPAELDFDLSAYIPAGTEEDDLPYQNFSNHYGAEQAPAKPSAPKPSVPKEAPTIAQRKAAGKKPPRSRGCCGCGLIALVSMVLVLVIGVSALLGLLPQKPVSADSNGTRKPGVSTVLLCGTDKDGTRTDTMMLIYMDTKEDRVGLLSLPRDTLTRTDSGKRAKLNSAYGRNGCGEKGMEWTLNYVQKILGYRPDGYILVDMDLVPQVVDLMGGVDVYLDHHIRVETDGVEVFVDKGQQHLNGEQTLATLRYRYGYSNADLGRVQVQRKVIQACIEQWVNPAKLAQFPAVMDLIEEESLTDLELRNFLWIAKALLGGMGELSSDTLPGYAQNRGGASYFILYPEKVAALVNERYNPYVEDIDVKDLDIEE